MQKFTFGGLFTAIAIAVAMTTSVTTVKAEAVGEYLDTTTPQVIEKMAGNIITFRNSIGESHNYYVPTWMIEKYNLQIGTSANLYNRNVIQGMYQDRYINVVNQGLPANMSAFTIHEVERHCTVADNPAGEAMSMGGRVWYLAGNCPSAIPIVGSMSFYKAKLAVAEQRDVSVLLPDFMGE
jgi:hypothetical protein